MEPLTTASFMLAASLICTPKTATPRLNKVDSPQATTWVDVDSSIREIEPIYSSTVVAPATQVNASRTIGGITTVTPTLSKENRAWDFTDKKDRLYAKLVGYLPSMYKGDPAAAASEEDVVTAIRFIRSLPSGIPLPRIMRSEEGELGMYWDDDDAYIDINIEAGGRLSLFARVRSTNEENFVGDIDIEAADANWAREHLAVLRHKNLAV